MSGRLLAGVANAFLLAYALDAGLSLVEQAVRELTGSVALLDLRNLLALAVVIFAVALLPAVILTPRLAPSVVIPLAASAVWMATGAAPVPMLVPATALESTLVAFQLGMTALAFLRVRTLSSGRRWLLGPEAPGPVFSLRHTVVATAVFATLGPVLLLLYAPLWLLMSLQLLTDGFVRFDLEGVSLADRRYERRHQDVRLVGMMHIGEPESYEALAESFSAPSTLVLEEGVTDREGLLRSKLSYENVADALGLAPQAPIGRYLEEEGPADAPPWPELRHADLDVSDFQVETVRWIELVSEVWASDSPIEAVTLLARRQSEDPGLWPAVREDLLERRNRHLIEALDDALLEYDRVVVPWGALHQPAFQQHLLESGFVPAEASYRRLASWRTIARALLARDPEPD